MTPDPLLSEPIRRIVDFYRSPPPLPAVRVSGADIRSRWARTAALLNSGCPAWDSTTHHAGDVAGARVDVTVFAAGPSRDVDASPAVLFVHGGAWVAGSTETHRQLCVRLAQLGVVVASVDYPLAPEHPFPAALNACDVALRWLLAHAHALGIDAGRLAIAGDSAGANLVGSLLHDLLASDGRTPFRATVLAYGVFDFPAMLQLPHGTPFVDGTTFSWQVEDYVGLDADEARVRDPRISPRFSPHLSGFPPSLLVVGGDDPLVQQTREFAAALVAAGVSAEARVYSSATHAFLQMEELPATQDALTAIGEFLSTTLAAESAQG